MARIEGITPEQAPEEFQPVFEQQARRWGKPLGNHLIYVRRPSIYHGARAMWRGLDESGLLDGALHALLNRRVALVNGCVF